MGFIPVAFFFARRPVAHRFQSPQRIGIVRIRDAAEYRLKVFFTGQGETTAYDPIFFHRTIEPISEIFSWTNQGDKLYNDGERFRGRVTRSMWH